MYVGLGKIRKDGQEGNREVSRGHWKALAGEVMVEQ